MGSYEIRETKEILENAKHQPGPRALTREQVEAGDFDRAQIIGMIEALAQQAQEVERLKVDAQLGRDLCAILQNHVGETGLTEGAVEVLKRKLQQLDGAERERDAAVSVCDDFKCGFGEARQQLASMTAERDELGELIKQETNAHNEFTKWAGGVKAELAASQARVRELEDCVYCINCEKITVSTCVPCSAEKWVELQATLAEREKLLRYVKAQEVCTLVRERDAAVQEAGRLREALKNAADELHGEFCSSSTVHHNVCCAAHRALKGEG